MITHVHEIDPRTCGAGQALALLLDGRGAAIAADKEPLALLQLGGNRGNGVSTTESSGFGPIAAGRIYANQKLARN